MLYALLQIADSLFPSGAFAHSCGLEGLLASVPRTLTPEQLQPMVAAIFTEHLLRCDGLLGIAAHRAVMAGSLSSLRAADRTLSAMKLPRELRAASVSMGRSFLAEVTLDVPHKTLTAWRADLECHPGAGNYSIAFHAVAAAAEIAESDAALAWGYQSIAQMAGALLRLGAIGHRGGQGLLSALRPIVERGVKEMLDAAPEAVSSFAPRLEIASMRHERQYSRLFRS